MLFIVGKEWCACISEIFEDTVTTTSPECQDLESRRLSMEGPRIHLGLWGCLTKAAENLCCLYFHTTHFGYVRYK